MQSLPPTPRERLNEGHRVPLQAPPQAIQQDHRTSKMTENMNAP
jgi:hypothetical protein